MPKEISMEVIEKRHNSIKKRIKNNPLNRAKGSLLTPVFLSHSSLDWYKLTENTRHVLNAVITQASKVKLAEMAKEKPDQKKILRLTDISRGAMAKTRDAKLFESKELM